MKVYDVLKVIADGTIVDIISNEGYCITKFNYVGQPMRQLNIENSKVVVIYPQNGNIIIYTDRNIKDVK